MLSIKENLFYFFKGYTRENPNIETVIKTDSWAEAAQRELDRRRHLLIENFNEEELQAIANGDIDLNDIIRSAAESHKKK